METRKVETKVVVLVSAVVGLLAFSLFALAGGLENNRLASQMGRPFDRIHDAITSQNTKREGYCRIFGLGVDPITIFTVPDGKRFISLKLYSGTSLDMSLSGGWNLTVDDSRFLQGSSADFDIDVIREARLWGFMPASANRDFPSRCAVVYADETLAAHGSGSLTITGYFHDVQ